MPRFRMPPLVLAFGFIATTVPGAGAQQLATPSDWRWRLDTPARLVTEQAVPDSAWRFVTMAPGWHVTTGPSVILFHPESQAAGRYALSADFLLFPNPGDAGYGFVLGASDLASPNTALIAVQLRRDGAARVAVTRRGKEETLAAWTIHQAIHAHPGSGVVSNRLRVEVGSDSLRVFVNDTAVVAVGAAALTTDGQFGLQIGKNLNFHITTFDLISHLAPARTP